jgi:hypothetical protein
MVQIGQKKVKVNDEKYFEGYERQCRGYCGVFFGGYFPHHFFFPKKKPIFCLSFQGGNPGQS